MTRLPAKAGSLGNPGLFGFSVISRASTVIGRRREMPSIRKRRTSLPFSDMAFSLFMTAAMMRANLLLNSQVPHERLSNAKLGQGESLIHAGPSLWAGIPDMDGPAPPSCAAE